VTDPAPGARRRSVIRRPPADRRVLHRAIAPVEPLGVVVAIPARDEAESIVACLASIDRAAAGCTQTVRVVVAADRCRDDTAELAAGFTAAHCSVTVLTRRWTGVSAARAAAVAVGLGDAAEGWWIANTDADCRVPPDWLARQIDLARRHVHAVAGIVRIDPGVSSSLLAERFRRHYAVGTTRHRHVHAANLGICVEAYRAVGGWPPHSALGEEHHLWRRLRQGRFDTVQDSELWVFTSHRTHSRVIGGFATRLRHLLAEPALDPTGTS
jgi:glycosyltransferase involved in cell wall biosynthesis